MKKIYFVLLVLAACTCRAQQTLSLAGAWQFSTEDSVNMDDYVFLPGSMLTNEKGTPVSLSTPWTGSLYDSSFYYNPAMERYRSAEPPMFPFFLTPERHYVGAAWYQRQVYVPRDWKNQRVMLFLERPHIETTVYVNGHLVGHDMSLSTPHVYDVTKHLRFGQQNQLLIRVYNGIENVCVGQDSHSVTDQTQGNWNGIVGRIELQARPKHVNIRRVRVFPDALSGQVHVKVDLENHVNLGLPVHVMQVWEYGLEYQLLRELNGRVDTIISRGVQSALQGRHMEFDLNLLHTARRWDEFNPVIYRLIVYAGDDSYETTFGLRDVTIKGREMRINGRPLFLRGTVENCCFPETGYPPTDVESWLKIFRRCKQWGLNHVRFHSWCPPEAAFEAADRVGIYLQPEGPSWPNHGVRLRRGMAIDQYLLDESKRIVDTYGNHPSFLMMAAGNEPAGDWVAYCNDWVREMHQYDSTRVYCGASVGGGWAWDEGSEYHVNGGARGLDWDRHAPQSTDDYYDQILRPRNFKPSAAPAASSAGSGSDATSVNTSPIIAHEQGQWCAFPDLAETSQYTGAYRPLNFELFRDLLARNGMAGQARRFLMASGRLQTLCYKYEIERNLRTPEYTGFQLLSLNDYSGQGTALVGPLNVFWREKGYVTARQWQEFCSSLVVLARFPKFVFSTAERLHVPIEMYNAFYGDLSQCTVYYELVRNDSTILRVDTIANCSVPVGKNNPLGTIDIPLDSIPAPSKLTLTVTAGNIVRNHWDFWVYPSPAQQLPAPPGERLRVGAPAGMGSPQDGVGSVSPLPEFTTLNDSALALLRSGHTVLLTAAGHVTFGDDVKQTFLPVFWNTSWFKMRPPHTTGAYIQKDHPLFSYGFPTDDWANLNWWELLNRAQVMNLRELPADYQPPIQPIDTWHVSRKLGMLIEARVLSGRLLMTTMDISTDLEHRLVARQMRHAITAYMQSPDFQPDLELSPDIIAHFFTEHAPAVDMYTNGSPDELKPAIK